MNLIYNILVEMGGAHESMRSAFLYHHVSETCKEWRFGGKLGFGGKYRSATNTVDCYGEDETPARKTLIEEINLKLKNLENG